MPSLASYRSAELADPQIQPLSSHACALPAKGLLVMVPCAAAGGSWHRGQERYDSLWLDSLSFGATIRFLRGNQKAVGDAPASR